jgi:hypothetical protein
MRLDGIFWTKKALIGYECYRLMTARLRHLFIAALLFSNFTHAADAGVRTWKSSAGTSIEAAFVGLQGDAVKLRTADGRELSVPLNRLSAEDQTWVKTQSGGAPAATATTDTSTAPVADKVWPKSVGLDDKPVVEVIKEDEAKKEFIYRSPHYEFVCDSRLGGNVVREFGRMFEATYLLNCKLPLDLKPKPEALREFFLAKLYTSRDDYLANGGAEGSAGIYRSADKALSVPLSSLGVKMVGSRVSLDKAGDDDNATLIHEITHQMMNHWLPMLPTWYAEGSAEYVEMLEYNPNGRFSLSSLRKRLEQYALQQNRWQTGPFKMLDLQELMNIESDAWRAALTNGNASQNYGSAGLLTYFFYHCDDKGDAANITAWLRELEAGGRGVDEAAAAKKHLLRERTYEQLAEEVKKGLKKEGVDIEFSPPGQNSRSSGGS